MKVLVTGGAGFIGSHLVDELVRKGYSVRVYDNLEKQVHTTEKPNYLNTDAEYIWGDIRQRNLLKKALQKVDVVFHFASVVGVGQSQYQVARYVEVNDFGTANLWDVILHGKNKVTKVIVAGSMSSYGEGLYQCKNCGILKPSPRCEEDLNRKIWELYCSKCKEILNPLPTPEDVFLDARSVYALTKKNQEELSLLMGRIYQIPVVILRFFNVYGPRQALSNPYTGVCAIFISRIKNNKEPLIFEDGNQSRDFISIYDCVRASLKAMESPLADYQVFNIGSGQKYTILEVANLIAKYLNKEIKPSIPGWYRKGDIRHCYADIGKIKKLLNWQPEVSFEKGMKDLISWAKAEPAFDRLEKAIDEIVAHNLVKIT